MKMKTSKMNTSLKITGMEEGLREWSPQLEKEILSLRRATYFQERKSSNLHCQNKKNKRKL